MSAGARPPHFAMGATGSMGLVVWCATLYGAMICISGCGSSTGVSGPAPSPKAAAADVTVTLDGVKHLCNVALSSETQGSSIACADLVPFLKEELRLRAGAVYDLRITAGVSTVEATAVSTSLRSAGYLPAGGH